MKKLLFIPLSLSFLVACGGGDGSNAEATNNNLPSEVDLTQQCKDPSNCTKEDIIRILKLPEMPDETIAHEKVLGIDTDKDEVRDDLKVKVGLATFPDVEAQKVFDRKSWLWTRLVKEYNKTPRDMDALNSLMGEYTKISYCYLLDVVNNPAELSDYDDQLMYGFDRPILEREIFKFLEIRSGTLPSMAELNKYCKSF